MADYGLIVGTSVFMIFGFVFAFLIPRLMAKNERLTEDGRRLAQWLRWLGLTLVIISFLAAAAIYFLPKGPAY